MKMTVWLVTDGRWMLGRPRTVSGTGDICSRCVPRLPLCAAKS
jgi:hypothetical protein